MNKRLHPRLLRSEYLRRCALGECHAACCQNGVWVDRLEAQVIREQAALIAPHMEAERRDPRDWFDGREEADEYAVSGWVEHSNVLDGRGTDWETVCVFLRGDHKCALQVAAGANGLHPWQWKPFYCILHPLDLDEQGRMILEENEVLLEEAASCLRQADHPIPLVETFEPELRYLLGEKEYQEVWEEINEHGTTH